MWAGLLSAQIHSPFIHVDQFGYLPDAMKVAVFSDPQEGYNNHLSYEPSAEIQVRNAEGELVYTAAPQAWNAGAVHSQSGDRGWWFDFSVVNEPGTYYIYDPVQEAQSAAFQIDEGVYYPVLKAAGRMFYYNRCNAAKPQAYAGQWTDGVSFLNPLQDANCRYIGAPGNASLEKDLSGGWFDAGDYNKYVTFASSAVHNLLSAYEENPQAFGDDWNIPESGNGIPDLIDEIKWELDWLLKMVNEDGSVTIKMGSQNHSENAASPPSQNTDPRFYGPTCSSASIAAAGMLAHAYFLFNTFPELEPYASELLDRAALCFAYSMPFAEQGTFETDCDDLSIVAGDADRSAEDQTAEFVLAAVYLLQATGDMAYGDWISTYAPGLEQIASGFWGPYNVPLSDALIRYSKLPDADQAIAGQIEESLEADVNNNYNGYYGFSTLDLYRAYMPDWSYHWGSNFAKASYANLNYLVSQSGVVAETGPLLEYLQEGLHYFHGVNPQSRVYLSNMYPFGAEHSVNEMYHLWFADGSIYDHAQDSPLGPAPGYVVGGPNASFSIPSISPPGDQPVQKSYLDFNTSWPQNSWEITEPAIYYQATYLRLLAHQVEAVMPTGVKEAQVPEQYRVYPNPVHKILQVEGDIPAGGFEIFSPSGGLLKQGRFLEHSVNVSELPAGLYFLRIGWSVQPFVKH
jgi:hypothetical protein